MFEAIKKYFAVKEETTPAPVIDKEVSVAAIPWLLYLADNKKPYRVYNPAKLLTTKGYEVYDEMRKDEQLKAALLLKKGAVISSGWDVEGEDEEMVDFVEDVIKNLPGTFNQKIIEILTALDYGFSVTEKLWTYKNDRIILGDLKTRKPHYFSFEVDSGGNLQTLLQNNNELTPADKFIIYTNDKTFDNPYGTSDLEAAYRWWWLKDNAIHWMGMLLERLGIPPIFMTYDQQQFTDPTTMQTILKNLQAGTVGTIPRGQDKDGITFWTPELAANVGTVFLPALEHCDKGMAKAILMPGLIGLGDDGTTGSLARAKVHFDVFMLIVEKLRQEIEELIINEQIIRPMIDYNFPNVEEYPVFKFNPFTTELKVDLYKQWTDMIAGNVVTKQPADEDHIRSVFGFPELEEGVESVAVPQGSTPAVQTPDTNAPAAVPPDVQAAEVSQYAQAPDVQIRKDFDEVTALAMENLSAAYTTVKEKMHARFLRLGKVTPQIINDLRLGNAQAILDAVSEMMRQAYERGGAQVKSTLPRKHALPRKAGFMPREALSWLSAKAMTAAATSNEKLLANIRQALLQGVKQGESVGQMVDRVDAVFDPWLGNDAISDSVTEPSYLETVVRTNVTEAYNQGRLMMMRDPDVADLVTGYQYSAIMDNRTTEICSFLHGKIFMPGDPDVDTFTPPNHFNCRSIWNPVMLDQKFSSDDVITETEKGQAKDMLTTGFYAFNPDQPRDDNGKWTAGGGSPTGGVSPTGGSKDTRLHLKSELLHADSLYEDYGASQAIKDSVRGNPAKAGDVVDGAEITKTEADEINRSAEVLQNAAETSKSEHKVLYRGLVFNSEKDIPQEWLKKGSVLEADSLTSTTGNRGLAEKYMDPQFIGADSGHGVLFRFSNHAGQAHTGYDRKSQDAISETILPRGAKYKVGSVSKLSDGKTIIDLYRPSEYYSKNPNFEGKPVAAKFSQKSEDALSTGFYAFNPDQPRDDNGKWTGGQLRYAADAYKRNSYYDINSKLRNGKESELSQSQKTMIAQLDHLTQSSHLAEDTVLYRAVAGKRAASKYAKEGSVVEDKAFMSTSTTEQGAHNAMRDIGNKDYTIVQIHVPKGQPAFDIQANHTGAFLPSQGQRNESELLLPRNTKVTVVGTSEGKIIAKVLR